MTKRSLGIRISLPAHYAPSATVIIGVVVEYNKRIDHTLLDKHVGKRVRVA